MTSAPPRAEAAVRSGELAANTAATDGFSRLDQADAALQAERAAHDLTRARLEAAEGLLGRYRLAMRMLRLLDEIRSIDATSAASARGAKEGA